LLTIPTSNYSDVFATCSSNEIRIWNTKNRQELLRIQVPNIDCHTVTFMNDGKSIISGWSDGKIRAFFPQSGKLMYSISDAHNHGVTALTTTNDCQKIISGGSEGEVRVWRIGTPLLLWLTGRQANAEARGFDEGAQRESLVHLDQEEQRAGRERLERRLLHHLGSQVLHPSALSLRVDSVQAGALPSRREPASHHGFRQKGSVGLAVLAIRFHTGKPSTDSQSD